MRSVLFTGVATKRSFLQYGIKDFGDIATYIMASSLTWLKKIGSARNYVAIKLVKSDTQVANIIAHKNHPVFESFAVVDGKSAIY